jgi:hypothetical protein
MRALKQLGRQVYKSEAQGMFTPMVTNVKLTKCGAYHMEGPTLYISMVVSLWGELQPIKIILYLFNTKQMGDST